MADKNNSCSNPADASSGSSSMEVEACQCEYVDKRQKHLPSEDKKVDTSSTCQKPSDNNASSLDDEVSGQSQECRRELNLDLTISFPSSGVIFFKEKSKAAEMTANCREIDCGGSPDTLLLFR
ncbi:hypothetical protein SAY86_003916 [Trapa natans]|uniref:Uncharacterized protein n=1 Tax=Trapa natans TaxID=22666 RepID=A0AAN7MET4_TRANT|nr:hypothetical protein SAY86_003916 [Trapa natans]